MRLICTNKKASFNYFIISTLQAGICLVGSEVKSIRNGDVNLNDSFIFISNGEVFLKNAYIKKYKFSSAFQVDERRSRKLLLNKNEISKLESKVKEKGFTLVPVKMYFDRGFVKVEIAIAKGKKLYDKRESLKEKATNLEIQRNLKNIKP